MISRGNEILTLSD